MVMQEIKEDSDPTAEMVTGTPVLVRIPVDPVVSAVEDCSLNERDGMNQKQPATGAQVKV